MDILSVVRKEYDQEAINTRRMLQRVPNDKWDWKPHEKSMTMMQLTTHICELAGWITMGMQTTEMDFAKQPYTSKQVTSTTELLEMFEKSLASGRQSLADATESDLLPDWTLRDGDQVYMVLTKYELIRHSLSQTIHHRAQLGVFLRLLDIAIPSTYGPSADEQTF